MKERFPPETERKLLALGNRRYLRVLALTIGWILLVLAAWLYTAFHFARGFTSPSNFVFPLLWVLPFYPLRVQNTLCGKTFYANVVSAKYSSTYKALTGPMTWKQMREMEVSTADVVFDGDHGERLRVTYKERSVLANEIYYKPGDRVLVLRGLKYPVKCPIPDDAEYLCPVCGNFIKPGRRRCQWCRANFE